MANKCDHLFAKHLTLESYYFHHLLAGLGTDCASICAVGLAHLLGCASAARADLGTCLARISIQWRIALHEVGRRQTDLSAVLQQADVSSMILLIASSFVLFHRLHTDSMTVQAILNTLLHLYLAQLVSCILLHCSPLF